MSTHVLKPRPPLRAFALTAILALVGVVVFASPDLFGWDPVLRTVGIAVLVLGFGILVLAFGAMRRNQVQVILDAQGYRVVGPDRTRTGSWEDITKVTRANRQLILYGRDGKRTAITLPRGGGGDLDALGADVARRLDTQRGYGSPVGQFGQTGQATDDQGPAES